MEQNDSLNLMELERSGYDVAQICRNGHVINKFANNRFKQNQPYCVDCGVSTITQCENCERFIKGGRLIALASRLSDEFHFPGFCSYCGKAYPWTELKLKAAKDLTELVPELNNEEKEALKQSIDDIVRDNPQTHVAAS